MSISTQTQDKTTVITIKSPPVNALSSKDLEKLFSDIDQCSNDRNVRSIIIKSEGKGFCAGADLKEDLPEGVKAEVIHDLLWKTARAIRHCDVPVITLCHGYVIGAGLFIASASDIVLAKEGCFFQMPGIHLDILIGNAHLQRLLPAPVVREMVLTGKKITVEKIFHFGGISKIFKNQDAMQEHAEKITSKINSLSPRSITTLKKIMNEEESIDVDAALKQEQQYSLQLNKSS